MIKPAKVEWGIGVALLTIIALMPFHAFFSVWLGSLTGHETLWQSWKELVLGLAAAATLLLAWKRPETRRRLQQPLLLLIYAYIAFGFVVSLLVRAPIVTLIYGTKTDFEFLVAFACAYAVSGQLVTTLATKLLLAGVAAVGLIGTLQAFILPKDILVHFGYGAHTIMPFENLTAGVTSFRILATLGGPNQLGSYLVLPICLIITLMIRRMRWWQPLILVLALVSLWHTYSRSAWLATIVAVGITIAIETPQRYRRRLAASAIIAGLALGAILAVGVARHTSLQAYVLHGNLTRYIQAGSDAQRLSSQRHGLALIRQQPLGRGLGAAGPASKYGTTYTITENYYLQLAVELGIAGLLLFVAIEVVLAKQLWDLRKRLLPAAAVLGTLAGISLINFFLHGWADSSTALIYWTYAGLALGCAYTKVSHAE